METHVFGKKISKSLEDFASTLLPAQLILTKAPFRGLNDPVP